MDGASLVLVPDLSFLGFLAEPWFVLPWYAAGVAGAAWVLFDSYRFNTAVPTALKWAWPIIVFFFSAVGILLYLNSVLVEMGWKHGTAH